MSINRPERLFNGRERVVRELVQGILSDPPTSFSLVGSKLVGKSRLLQFLASDEGPLLGEEYASLRPYPHEDGSSVFAVRVDCGLPDAREDFMGYLYAQIVAALQKEGGLGLRQNNDELSASTRLTALMRQINDRGYRAVLLLDNFDRVFGSLPLDTLNELRPLTPQAALVVATEQPLHDLDKTQAASPLFNVMTQLFIGLVEPDAARRWLEEYGATYPGITPILGELQELTGTHPYLLRRMGEILQEVRQMLPADASVQPEHLPLIRLRLAEHGRLLFETLWRRMQTPPERVQQPVVLALLRRMLHGSITLQDISREESVALNWIINQAMVVCCGVGRSIGYELFSPLLGDYLSERLVMDGSEAPASANGASGEPADASSLANLTKIEAALLLYFQSHSRQVIPPEQLLRDVWKRPDATVRRVQEAIRRLRIELEEASPAVGVIENDRGRGYRFVPAAR